jgi:hypothetical protein
MAINYCYKKFYNIGPRLQLPSWNPGKKVLLNWFLEARTSLVILIIKIGLIIQDFSHTFLQQGPI